MDSEQLYQQRLAYAHGRLRDAADALARAARAYQDSNNRIAGTIAALEGMRGQPVVLERTSPGPSVRVFHDEARSCGKVGDRRNFRAVFYEEARAQRLRACGSCGYRATRAYEEWAAEHRAEGA